MSIAVCMKGEFARLNGQWHLHHEQAVLNLSLLIKRCCRGIKDMQYEK